MGRETSSPPNWAEQCICSLWSSSWLYQRTFTESKTPHRLGPRHAWGISYSCINVLRVFFFFLLSAISPVESCKKRSLTLQSFPWDSTRSWDFLPLFSISMQSMWPGCYVTWRNPVCLKDSSSPRQITGHVSLSSSPWQTQIKHPSLLTLRISGPDSGPGVFQTLRYQLYELKMMQSGNKAD